METPILTGEKRSRFNFKKIVIYEDRLYCSDLFIEKTIPIKDISSWTEINKKLRNNALQWQELTIYTPSTEYRINSLRWHNYNEIKFYLTQGIARDVEKENKIKNSFWQTS